MPPLLQNFTPLDPSWGSALRTRLEDNNLTPHLLPIRLLVEPHQQRFTPAHGRRPQVAGGSEQVRKQRRIVRRSTAHVEGNNLLAPGHHDLRGGPRQGQRLVASAAFPAGIALIVDFEPVGLKEPLSFLAACSALSMIKPVDVAGHESFTPA